MKGGSAVSKSVKCTVLCLIMVCTMVFSLPLTASAYESYNIAVNEPTKSENQGYILLLVNDPSTTGSYAYQVQLISWTLYPVYTDNHVTYNATEMMIDFPNSYTVSFTGRCSGNFQLSAGFGLALSGDSQRNRFWDEYSNSNAISFSHSVGSSKKIVGYQIYGNGVNESTYLNNNNNIPFGVSWGDDNFTFSKLTEIISQLNVFASNDTKILYRLELILNDTTDIKNTLHRLEDLLEQLLDAKGESTFEEPSTESISDYNKAEDELVSGADDTSEIEQQIEDFEIDADSSSLIWGIIQGYLNQSELVFGLVVGILCLGIIALILNR